MNAAIGRLALPAALLAVAVSGTCLGQTTVPAQRGTTGLAAPAAVPATPLPSTAGLRPGEGIGSVEVGIRKRPRGEIAATARTDAQGNFTIAGLPAGTYDLTLILPAQSDATRKFWESRSNTVRLEVTLHQDAKAGGTNTRVWTWAPASGEFAAAGPGDAQPNSTTATLQVRAGDTVRGSVRASVRSRSNTSSN